MTKKTTICEALDQVYGEEAPRLTRRDIDLLHLPLSKVLPIFTPESWHEIARGIADALPRLEWADKDAATALGTLGMNLGHFAAKAGMPLDELDDAISEWLRIRGDWVADVHEESVALRRVDRETDPTTGRKPKVDAGHVAECFRRGLGYSAAAKELGVDASTVRKLANRYGIRPYTAAEWRAIEKAREGI